MPSSNDTAVANDIAAWFSGMYSDLESLRDELTPKLSATFSGTAPFEVAPDVSAEIKAGVTQYLVAHPRFDGAGLIFQPALLEPRTAKLEWWTRDGSGFSRHVFSLDPTSERFYDYEYLEWFRGGFERESRTLAGPYIDHLGIDEYITTMTVPAYVDGRKVGVAGQDMLMRDLETALLRLLHPLDHEAAVLSSHGQVVVGNSGRLTTGVRVAALPHGYARIPIEVAGLGLSLLYQS